MSEIKNLAEKLLQNLGPERVAQEGEKLGLSVEEFGYEAVAQAIVYRLGPAHARLLAQGAKND